MTDCSPVISIAVLLISILPVNLTVAALYFLRLASPPCASIVLRTSVLTSLSWPLAARENTATRQVAANHWNRDMMELQRKKGIFPLPEGSPQRGGYLIIHGAGVISAGKTCPWVPSDHARG